MSELSPRTTPRRELLLGAALALVGAALHALLIPASLRERSDLPLYLQAAARWALDGAAPYREIPFEYPPAALLLLRAPIALVATGLVHYERALELVLLPFDALALFASFLIARAAAPRADVGAARLRSPLRRGLVALLFAWGALLLCGSLLFTRFDLAPAALLALAVALVDRRPGASGAALGAATALKLYPIWAAPALGLQLWRRGRFGRALLCGLLAGLLLSLPAALPAGIETLSFLGYHAQRGVQLQSLWGALALLLGKAGLLAVSVEHAFGSEEVHGAPAIFLLLGTALPLLWMLFAGQRARTIPARCAAFSALAGFVALGKIGSPQFAIALAPLAAACMFDTPLATLCALGGIALGAVQFPFHHDALVRNESPWALLALLRMLLLLAAALLAALPDLSRAVIWPRRRDLHGESTSRAKEAP